MSSFFALPTFFFGIAGLKFLQPLCAASATGQRHYITATNSCCRQPCVSVRYKFQNHLLFLHVPKHLQPCTGVPKFTFWPATVGSFPALIPKEILETHDDLLAERKLTHILISKTTSDIPIKAGGNVQIIIGEPKEKRRKW